MTFEDFLSEMPGLSADARGIYLLIDAEASRVGAELAARCTPAEHRSRAGSQWLEGFNRDRADALERDPSGRLAAMPAIHVWARRADGIGGTFANWYCDLLLLHIKAQARPQLIAAE